MTSTNQNRPTAVWIAVVLLLVLAFLSAVGGYLFNLSGANDIDDYVIGGAFVVLGGIYLVTAMKLPAGDPSWRLVAIATAAAHGIFNAVVKVGIERETESLMFVALTLALLALLALPRTRGFFSPGPLPA